MLSVFSFVCNLLRGIIHAMNTQKFELLDRGAFSALTLHQKNEYLQKLTARYMEANGRSPIELSREALSRLRRFYSRRSMADLKLEKMTDREMASALSRVANAVGQGDLEKRIESEIPPTSELRAPPIDDDQLMFFVPNIHDAPIKDDVNVMDVAPFSLSKTKREGKIRYDLKDSSITVTGGSDSGMANAYDYDIFINMVSYLAEEMRTYRLSQKKGRNPSLPAKVYCPTASQVLKFCRRGNGGKQYVELENALDRLQDTRIKITNFKPGARRETETFSLIDRYRVLSRTTSDRIDHIEIIIPDWVYEGIVNESGSASILTLNPDYFLIKKPTARFIYRLARKAAGQGEAHYTLKDLHHRSGTTIPFHKFRNAVADIVDRAENEPFPDYELKLIPGRECQVLRICRRPVA
ncbi:replication initiator protein A [Phycobacter azelaicus]|uniref:replication initiator protein A n=1 Tax=Phycobacter azelaicus TaxID=2668075 RepID=UPI0034E1A5C4